MGEFFKGWRRRVGITMLVLACVFMAGWLRSPFQQDTLSVSLGTSFCIKLISVSHHLIIATLRIETDHPIPISLWSSERAAANQWVIEFDRNTMINGIKDQSFSADDADDVNLSVDDLNISVKSVQVAYWLVLFPLTLVSVFLLFFRPQSSKSTTVQSPQAATSP